MLSSSQGRRIAPNTNSTSSLLSNKKNLATDGSNSRSHPTGPRGWQGTRMENIYLARYKLLHAWLSTLWWNDPPPKQGGQKKCFSFNKKPLLKRQSLIIKGKKWPEYLETSGSELLLLPQRLPPWLVSERTFRKHLVQSRSLCFLFRRDLLEGFHFLPGW